MKNNIDYEYFERIMAFCPKTQFRVEMHFKSIAQAKKFNPYLEDFQSIGTIKVKKSHY